MPSADTFTLGLARLTWRRRLPWLVLGLVGVLAGLLWLRAQALPVIGFLHRQGVNLDPGPCPSLLACGAHLERYLGWLGAWADWLVAHGRVSVPLLVAAGGLLLLGGLLAAYGLPKPWDATLGAHALKRLGEEHPWTTQRARPLALPAPYGAQWATASDLKGLLAQAHEPPSDALLLGVWGGRTLALRPGFGGRREIGHLLVVAPSRLGKGLNLATNLTNWRSSAIVNDLKGELYASTAELKRAQGFRVLALNPNGLGDPFDPFAELSVSDEGLRAAAQIIMRPEEDGHNRAFSDRASSAVYAALRAAQVLGRPTLPYLREVTARGLRHFVMGLGAVGDGKVEQALCDFLGDPPEEIDWGKGVRDEKYLQNSWENVKRRLKDFFAEGVLAMMSGSSFTAAELRERPSVLYLQWREEELEYTLPVYQLVVEALSKGLIRLGDERPASHARPLFWGFDEAASLVVPELPKKISTWSGRGMVVGLYLQSLGQLGAQYGPKGEKTILSSCHTQLFARAQDAETARYVAERAGEHTVPMEQLGREGGREGRTRGYTLAQRGLLPPERAERLADDELVIFCNDRPPIAAHRLEPRHVPSARGITRTGSDAHLRRPAAIEARSLVSANPPPKTVAGLGTATPASATPIQVQPRARSRYFVDDDEI